MSNRVYLNKDSITSVKTYGRFPKCNIYTKQFRDSFLGFKFGEEYTRYGTERNFNKSDSCETKEEILAYQNIYIPEVNKWFDTSHNAFYLDEKKDIIYRNSYGIINTSDNKTFVKFFTNEHDMDRYIDDLGVKKDLYGLEYDG